MQLVYQEMLQREWAIYEGERSQKTDVRRWKEERCVKTKETMQM